MIMYLQRCHCVPSGHFCLSSPRSLFVLTKAALFVSAVLIPSIHSLRPALLHDGGEAELSDSSPSISALREVMRWPVPRRGNSAVRRDHFSNWPRDQTPTHRCQLCRAFFFSSLKLFSFPAPHRLPIHLLGLNGGFISGSWWRYKKKKNPLCKLPSAPRWCGD